MHRFYVSPESVSGDMIEIKGPEYNHLVNVLRIRKGGKAVVSDNTGLEYNCEVLEISGRSAVLKIITFGAGDREPAVRIELYQAVPKSDKMDHIVQKSVELGVYRIYPVITKRVVARGGKDWENTKIERWNKIAREAAKQSERSLIPEVVDFIDFQEAVKKASTDSFCVFPYENEKIRRIDDLDLCSSSISVFIGPEGGYEEDEVNTAVSCGILPVTLGKRILRTETAAIAVLSVLMHIKREI